MEVLKFFVDALIIVVLVVLAGGTLIGYYFQKKSEYDIKKIGIAANVLTAAQKQKKDENG